MFRPNLLSRNLSGHLGRFTARNDFVKPFRLQSRRLGSTSNTRLVSNSFSGVRVLAYATALTLAVSAYGLHDSPIYLESAPIQNDSIRGTPNCRLPGSL